MSPRRPRFIACTACERHVREGDGACPFCGAKAPIAPPLRSLSMRLSRAALHAAGAAGAIAALNDCGGHTADEPYYGAACVEMDGSCNPIVYDAGHDAARDAANDGAYDAAPDTGGTEVFYGGPCPGGIDCPDTGAPTDAGDAGDAQVTDGPTDGGDGG